MVKLYFGRIPTYVITIHQRHRQTDGRTDGQTKCDRETALCTKVTLYELHYTMTMHNKCASWSVDFNQQLIDCGQVISDSLTGR